MSGVTTLNSLSGAVNIQGGTPNVSVATAGQNVSVSVASTGVTRLSTNPATANASGNVVLKAGTGMGIVADSFNNITFTATGGGGGSVAPVLWNPQSAYAVGAVASVGSLASPNPGTYVCIVAVTARTPPLANLLPQNDATHWTPLGSVVKLPTLWNAQSAYSVGDLASLGSLGSPNPGTYICISPLGALVPPLGNPSPTVDGTHWTIIGNPTQTTMATGDCSVVIGNTTATMTYNDHSIGGSFVEVYKGRAELTSDTMGDIESGGLASVICGGYSGVYISYETQQAQLARLNVGNTPQSMGLNVTPNTLTFNGATVLTAPLPTIVPVVWSNQSAYAVGAIVNTGTLKNPTGTFVCIFPVTAKSSPLTNPVPTVATNNWTPLGVLTPTSIANATATGRISIDGNGNIATVTSRGITNTVSQAITTTCQGAISTTCYGAYSVNSQGGTLSLRSNSIATMGINGTSFTISANAPSGNGVWLSESDVTYNGRTLTAPIAFGTATMTGDGTTTIFYIDTGFPHNSFTSNAPVVTQTMSPDAYYEDKETTKT